MLKDTILDEAQPVEVALATQEVQSIDLAKIGTLHELLGLALDDFEKVLRDPRYAVDMGNYHGPNPANEKCHVCLAGAVMAKSLGASPQDCITPSHFPDGVDVRLDALDALRTGAVLEAAEMIECAAADDRCAELDALSEKWTRGLWTVSDAADRRDGWRLLRKLRRMHVELKAAAI